MWEFIIPAAASLIGGALGSSASKSAANTQAAATDRATQAQRDMFERQVQLQEPWRQQGTQALNRLAYLAGVNSNPGGGTGTETIEQIRARLAPQYTTGGGGSPQMLWISTDNDGGGYYQAPAGSGGSVNEAALNDAVNAELARQQAGVNQRAAGDPQFGSLTRDFTMADYQADPGYAFRLEQGNKALSAAARANGTFGSGRYLKDAMAYNQGQASQEFNNSFNRFNINRGAKLNTLQSLAGIGQTATNQTAGAAGAFGQQLGSNIMGAGNAQAAGQVGSANAWANALGQGVSSYQSTNLMNRLLQPRAGAAGSVESIGLSPSYWDGGGFDNYSGDSYNMFAR